MLLLGCAQHCGVHFGSPNRVPTASAPRRWLGVDHVFLTDNEPDPALSLLGAPELSPFTASGFLSLRAKRMPQAQMSVYRNCIKKHAPAYNWMAFFDLDEFLILRHRCACAVPCHWHPLPAPDVRRDRGGLGLTAPVGAEVSES